MSAVVLVCVDESELSHRAVAAGMSLVDPALTPVVVTVIESADPSLVTGTGMAGGSMSVDEYRQLEEERRAAADQHLADAARALDLTGSRTAVVEGQPGPAICDLAIAEDAQAIVIGSRGRSGFKRAVLGSVSDHVVRHAPCPVVVTSAAAEHD